MTATTVAPVGQYGRMAVTRSAGILVFRQTGAGTEVLLGHFGGPFWARKDAGAWTIVKGEYEPDEPAMAAARREFTEELGLPAPNGEYLPLGEIRQPGGKIVTAWAVAGDLDPTAITPGTFDLEWPPRSGRIQQFPELDRAAWLTIPDASAKIRPAQRPFLDRLDNLIPERNR